VLPLEGEAMQFGIFLRFEEISFIFIFKVQSTTFSVYDSTQLILTYQAMQILIC
jgi:hypothetical protein